VGRADPKIILRLVWDSENDPEPIIEYRKDFNGDGKFRPHFLAKVVLLKNGEKIPVIAVFKQSQMRDIITVAEGLQEDSGIDVFDAVGGFPISIKTEGSGLTTKYSVQAVMKAVDISEVSFEGMGTLQQALAEELKLLSPKPAPTTSELDEGEFLF
jgi:hypothetical protein